MIESHAPYKILILDRPQSAQHSFVCLSYAVTLKLTALGIATHPTGVNGSERLESADVNNSPANAIKRRDTPLVVEGRTDKRSRG